MSQRLTCPECGREDRLYSVETTTTHYSVRPTGDEGLFEYTGEESQTFDEGATNTGEFWCGHCNIEFTH